MTDEFDPSAAAARATGDLVDTDGDDLADAPAPDAGADSGSDGDTSSSGGWVVVYLLPLLTASPAGPSAGTLRDSGIGGWVADVLDGLIDYVLHFSGSLGDELDDQIGPAGKIGRGLWRRFGDAGDDADADEHQEDASDDADAGSGPTGGDPL